MKTIRALVLGLSLMPAASASATQDCIYLRDGRVLSGTIVSEARGMYQLVMPGAWGTAISNIPPNAVRYVLYATPDKARRSLKLDETARALSVRNEGTIRFLPTEAFGETIVEAARGATERIWILAYYITGSSQPVIKEFYDTLRAKARAGVDVRIISEFGKATAMPIRNATRDFSETLMGDGVRIGFLQEYRVQHKKVILIDRRRVLLGSSNLTAAGTSFSDEFNVLVDSEAFAREAERDFLRISRNAKTPGTLKY